MMDRVRRHTRLLLLAGLAIGAAASAGAWFKLMDERRQSVVHTERELSNLAALLASATDNNFRSVELLQDALLELVEALRAKTVEEFDARLSGQTIHQELTARMAALPQIEEVSLVNAPGVVVASSGAWPSPRSSIAGQPHFLALRDHPEWESYLVPPSWDAEAGAGKIHFMRRIRSDDGEFLGLIDIGLSVARLEEFLREIAPGPGSAVGIWRRDSRLLARFPAMRAMPDGERRRLAAAFERALAQSDSAMFHGVSPVDGKERIIAVRALAGYPVVVSVARQTAAVFDAWHREIIRTILVLAALSAMAGIAIMLRVRQLRSQDQLDRAHDRMRELTARQQVEARIAHLAHHDALTGLANRLLLRKRLDEAVALARRGEACAVLCLDLDAFKDINDTLGHPVGDRLLQAVTRRLLADTRETDTVARLGGDEFAIVQSGIRDPNDAGLLAQRLIGSLGLPFDVDGHLAIVGVSIGVAIALTDGLDADQLLKNADIALYRAKASGRGCFRYYAPEMDTYVQMRRSLQHDLRRALETDEFVLFYQPQVDLPTCRVVGYEALLRWRHPQRGLVLPGHFIPLAEETRAIVSLGAWALRRACADAASWPGGQKVAVNLSPIQFAYGDLLSTVQQALDESHLDPTRLEIEITEMVLLQDTEAALQTLRELRALGVSIALDDFGTGYASLAYLHRFPFDRVKIDSSFVDTLGRSREGDAIVQAIVDLCRALDIVPLAEGIEREEQCRILRGIGCAEGQGYLFGCPAAWGDARGLP